MSIGAGRYIISQGDSDVLKYSELDMKLLDASYEAGDIVRHAYMLTNGVDTVCTFRCKHVGDSVWDPCPQRHESERIAWLFTNAPALLEAAEAVVADARLAGVTTHELEALAAVIDTINGEAVVADRKEVVRVTIPGKSVERLQESIADAAK